jgi:hypothetical protein
MKSSAWRYSRGGSRSRLFPPLFSGFCLTGLRLVEAGLTLVAEAQEFAKNELDRARGVRNGIIIALLALCPVRIKNFAALEIGGTFKEVNGSWWIALPKTSTKSHRPALEEEGRVVRTTGCANHWWGFH